MALLVAFSGWRSTLPRYHYRVHSLSYLEWVWPYPNDVLLTFLLSPLIVGIPEQLHRITTGEFWSYWFYYDSSLTLPHRHRSEEKRRKQDGMRELELSSQKDSDYALRIARERDAQSTGSRDRRKSFNNGSQGAPVTFPSMNGGTYPTHPSQVSGYPSNPYVGTYASPPGPTYPAAVNGHSRNRSSSGAGYSDLANQFSNLGMDHQKDYERDGTISSTKRSHKYSDSESFERARTVSGNYTDRNAYQAIPSAVYPAAPEPFANPQNHYPSSPYIIPSPNMHAGEVPYGSAGVSGYPTSSSSTYNTSPAIHSASIGCSTTPFGDPTPQVYPRGHILEGQSVTSNAGSTARSHGPSRAASPNPCMWWA